MTNTRSLIAASLIALFAAPAFAQQGGPGGSLYKEPQSRVYTQPADKAQTDNAKAPSAPVPAGAASGEGAAPATDPSLMGPRFGGG